ncbi:MAG TPA: 5'-methylthioadenosine phosphorylase [Methanoculleus sp.]|nr:5'-methylthioadenosine phosphorylase [Methanoculleus sp.]
MLGIIGGTSLRFSDLPPLEKRRIPTPYGPAEVYCGECALLLRHQYGRPPHRINYRASLAALAILGVDRVVAFGSAGSLKAEIAPGSLMVPDDYISTSDIPSIHDHAIDHVSPMIDPVLTRDLAALIPDAIHGGTYVQTKGPRIETVAEVKVLARVADIVGMTLASEATLACELGMRFAALCTVDNYAHGIGEGVLTYAHILETSRQHRKRTETILQRILEAMA